MNLDFVRPACRSLRSLVSVGLLLASAAMLPLIGGSALFASERPDGFDSLLTLFAEWRTLERPAFVNGAPDYTAQSLERQAEGLRNLKKRLEMIDPATWPVEQQVDYHLVRAEMNGLDFNLRVLRPWARDPAFYASVWEYQSDTPAHEGPAHHALVEAWSYEFPLAQEAENKLANELRSIPPLLTQARGNLVGNARELWQAGIGNLRDQVAALERLGQKSADTGPELQAALRAALGATRDFVTWLEAQAASKTGPSGIGKESYNWYLRHVHLVPMTWEEEVSLLRRELARAHSSLKLEEQRNRDLPPLVAIASPEEYDRRANEAVDRYLGFLKERDILTIHDYMDPALRAQVGSFVPQAQRNFFRTAIHYEPMTLWTHFYHWWDLARMSSNPHPSPIRRGPLLYNIFDSRAEGLATGVEEMMMHAGLYDDNPRAREIVWIMLAQRAARGLGSLYVHANEMTMKEARDFHVRWTPRGWMRKDLDLLGFEQLLYLRQPGYGSSYITGKYLIEELLKERSQQQGSKFDLKKFFAEVDAVGVVPVSMIRWQLTGKSDQIESLVSAANKPSEKIEKKELDQ